MKKNYIARIKEFAMPIMVLSSVFCSTCFAQEKLSNISNEPARITNSQIYVQSVTNDRTSITSTPQIKSDSPHFIQQFSQNKANPLPQSKSLILTPKQPEHLTRTGSLPIDE